MIHDYSSQTDYYRRRGCGKLILGKLRSRESPALGSYCSVAQLSLEKAKLWRAARLRGAIILVN
jgi:hypothetical protein